jgi:hypothetical protein
LKGLALSDELSHMFLASNARRVFKL